MFSYHRTETVNPLSPRTRFTDSLRAIRLVERMRAIERLLGCDTRACTLEVHDGRSYLDFSYTVVHNGERERFEQVLLTDPADGYLGAVLDRRTDGSPCGPWVPLVPIAVAEWVHAQHVAADARRETERRAAIEADPWREHAAMVALGA